MSSGRSRHLMELQSGRCARKGNARGTTDYSESESSSLLPMCSTVRYEISCLMPPFSGVLVPLCMLDVFLQININACGQELMLQAFVGNTLRSKIDLQKKQPLRWESRAPRGRMQVAANQLGEAFLLC